MNFVAEREGMTLTKYARNGATVGPAPTATGGQIITQVQSASSTAPAFVVFDGGTNDAGEIHDNHTYVIGTLSGSQDPSTFNTSTYAGALENTTEPAVEPRGLRGRCAMHAIRTVAG
ncbi:hypothetical protein [Streptomyces griseus]|uniref:hypothetical protein n=1 Tax=Streptomyces griseus TaxID=1911 RepID=UPI00055A26F8|nr:hypothetical protein [Streptomyces griseus]